MKKFLKITILLIILFTIYIYICAYSYVNAISNNISDSIFRLHVIANSDSIKDQELKYLVRGNLIEYMNSLCTNCSSKEEVIMVANNHLENFKKIAKKTIKDQGYNYDVQVEIGNFEFPTKTYGDISFPAGYYDALKVKIGKAQGKNWWCVMFPPLCFVDSNTGIVSDESKKNLYDNLSKEEYKIISGSESPDIAIKFKVVEFFENKGLITAKK